MMTLNSPQTLFDCIIDTGTSNFKPLLLPWMQFLRKMAQPYDKNGALGKKTLLSQEDLENMITGPDGEMLL